MFKSDSSLSEFDPEISAAIEAEKVAAEFYRMLGDACTDFEVKTHLALLEKAEREHCNVVEILKTRVLDGLTR